MHHRHLLPNEIDLLLDSEVGFGVSPLKAHIAECAPCRAQVDESRRVIGALDNLPRFAPSPSFAGRVMAQVQVVEPWHVALLDAARRAVPRSAPMRVVMAASAAVIATTFSSALLWLAFRTDVAMYLADQATKGLRTAATTGLASVVRDLLGSAAAGVVVTRGPAGAAAGLAALLAVAGVAALGLRRVAVAARRTRE
jgi:hypothetical protein